MYDTLLFPFLFIISMVILVVTIIIVIYQKRNIDEQIEALANNALEMTPEEFFKIHAHFTGKGNGDVYADYKYGHEFTIKMIALENSGFDSLNELERFMISKFKAFSKGYNKSRGNRV